MRRILLSVCFLAFLVSCNDEPEERLSGQVSVGINVTGPIDADHKFLLTFSGLVGDLELEDGVLVTANKDTTIAFNRVGERLSIFLNEVPSNCGNYSLSSSNIIALELVSPSEPGAVFGASIIVPLDGSLGEIGFNIECN